MKIAIVGGGISGLAFYLFLEKYGLTRRHTVLVYEARDATEQNPKSESTLGARSVSNIGLSIGLSSTGLKVLKRLDEGLYEEILRAGEVIQSCKVSNARGWTLANTPVGAADEIMLMIGREVFWTCLRKRVPQRAIVGRKVIQVVIQKPSHQNRIVTTNGQSEVADLVVGADGIWSVVRRAMFDGEDQAAAYEYSPQYEGLVGVGGFVPSSKLEDVPEGEMNVIFGRNGFFGHAYTEAKSPEISEDNRRAMWWSTYTLDSCPEDWRNIDRNDIAAQLRERHLNWRNKTIQNILKDVEIHSIYPTFITPLLPTWSRSGCVLVGDAAHALQPSSGQGASMALEDSEALALLLRNFLEIDAESGYREAIEVYSRMRVPRLKMVHKKAQEVGSMKQDMSLLQEMVMYLVIWLISESNLDVMGIKITRITDHSPRSS